MSKKVTTKKAPPAKPAKGKPAAKKGGFVPFKSVDDMKSFRKKKYGC